MAAFLDIEGAFHNVTNLAIQQTLNDRNVEKYIRDWLQLLSNWATVSGLGVNPS